MEARKMGQLKLNWLALLAVTALSGLPLNLQAAEEEKHGSHDPFPDTSSDDGVEFFDAQPLAGDLTLPDRLSTTTQNSAPAGTPTKPKPTSPAAVPPATRLLTTSPTARRTPVSPHLKPLTVDTARHSTLSLPKAELNEPASDPESE